MRRRAIAPSSTRPVASIAHCPGSGTAATLMLPSIYKREVSSRVPPARSRSAASMVWILPALLP